MRFCRERIPTCPRAHRLLTVLLGGVFALSLVAAAPACARTAGQIARDARTHEDAGRYAAALRHQLELRRSILTDADLELVIALNEARTGAVDSAWSRLHGGLLSAALTDTGDVSRRHDYPYERDGLWVNGRFDGWYWYVARARAELALERGDWPAARAAAHQALEARPYSGKDALLLALAAARVGDLEFSEAAAAYAAHLEPSLPEAHHLLGLHLWRLGKRNEATVAFQFALQADSSFTPAALALVRSRLPGARADTLPRGFLTGIRRAAELTSPIGPKVEEDRQQDTSPMLAWNPHTPLPQELIAQLRSKDPLTVYVHVLIDPGGRPRSLELPYSSPERIPLGVYHHLSKDILSWRFVAPTRFGAPVVAWVTAEYQINP